MSRIRVSVIVCTHNRRQYLPQNLEHLSRQSARPEHYEVLIIDNNSTDDTHEISKKFIAENPQVQALYFNEKNQGHTYARNRGIQEASGELLAFIDDDAFVAEDYIQNMVAFFDNNATVMAIGGKIIPRYEGSTPSWMSKYLLPLVSALDMGDRPTPFSGTKFPIGANMAYRKEAFDRYGTFDVALGRRGSGLEGGDEKEMIYRLKKDNQKIYYVPNVEVAHIIPEKRLQMDYIKGLAVGVAKSEQKRLSNAPFTEKVAKVLSELIKILGTVVLAGGYLLKFQKAKAMMLIKFRVWVLSGYIK